MVAALACALLAVGAQDAAPAPGRTVYAWFPRDVHNWDTRALDWEALTHLCFRSVLLQPDGSIREAVPRERVRNLVREAREHKVRVTVLAWGTTAADSSRYLAEAPEKTARSLLAYVQELDLDGVNIDDETWARENTVTKGPNRGLVTNFFRVLNRTFREARPGAHLSWASPPVIHPADRFGESWPDFAAIAREIDAFAVMSYCMNPPGIGWTGGAQPVSGGGKVGPHPRDYETVLKDYTEATGGARGKLLLGISNDRGGTEWDCRTDQPLSPILGKPRRLSPEEARANALRHGRRFDPRQRVPWYCAPKDSHWIQGWYEDEESLRAKLTLAREAGTGGACIWVLDGASEPPETFALLREYRRP